MTDDLVEFLRNRLDDDEKFMQAAIRLRESGAVVSSPAATEGAFALMDVVRNDPDTVQALTVFTSTGSRAPGEAERVLEEVAAKRTLIERFAELVATGKEQGHVLGGDVGEEYLHVVLPLLALSYARHPDYNEAWRP